MSMKTLLWKDFHQNRKILLGVAIIIAMPYCIALILPLFPVHEPLQDRIGGAAMFALMLSAGMAAFVAGNAIAGERADRSAEFAAYLPIKRSVSLISRAQFTILTFGLLFCFNLIVLRLAAASGGFGSVGVIPRNTFATSVLLFGVAWLFSSVTSSPAMSAAAALGSLVLLASTLAMIEGKWYVGHLASPFDWYATICIAAGVVTFLAGSVHYLLSKKA